MTGLWDHLALALHSIAKYCSYREEQRLVQFCMTLQDDFELFRCFILHQTPLPYVNYVRHKSQVKKVCLQSRVEIGFHSYTCQVEGTTPAHDYKQISLACNS